MKKLIAIAMLMASLSAYALEPRFTDYELGFNSTLIDRQGQPTGAAVDFFFKNRAGANYWSIGWFTEAYITDYRNYYGLWRNPMAAARFILQQDPGKQEVGIADVALCHIQTGSCTKDIGDSAEFTSDLQIRSAVEMMAYMRPKTDFFHIYWKHGVSGNWKWDSIYNIGAVDPRDEDCQIVEPGDVHTFEFDIPKGTGATLLFDIGTLSYSGEFDEFNRDIPRMVDNKLDHKFDIAYPIGRNYECFHFLDGSKICKPTLGYGNILEWQDEMFDGNNISTKIFWKARMDQMRGEHPIDKTSGQDMGCIIIKQPA